jgi:hypothetical protein
VHQALGSQAKEEPGSQRVANDLEAFLFADQLKGSKEPVAPPLNEWSVTAIHQREVERDA